MLTNRSNNIHLAWLHNNGTFDTRQIDIDSIANLYNASRNNPGIFTNFFAREYYNPKQNNIVRRLEETSYYQDENFNQKVIKLSNNIGTKLFSKLNKEQVFLMARTAGSLGFKKKIDINAVYTYIGTY